MGSRPIKLTIEGYVDKDLAIDLAHQGGILITENSPGSYIEALVWLGAMAQDESNITVTVERTDK